MTTQQPTNLWVVESTTERDALTTDDGVVAGDFALVQDGLLYSAVDADDSGSSWVSISGTPYIGTWGLSAFNRSGSSGTTRDQTGLTFRALLDAAPSSISTTIVQDSNWDSVTVSNTSRYGFRLRGLSDTINDGVYASAYGTYDVTL